MAVAKFIVVLALVLLTIVQADSEQKVSISSFESVRLSLPTFSKDNYNDEHVIPGF